MLWCVADDFGAQLSMEQQIVSWVNTVQTRGAGTHVDGLLRALGELGYELGLGDSLSPLVMLALFMPWPRYRAPTKDRLASVEAATFVYEHVLGPLRQHLVESPGLVERR